MPDLIIVMPDPLFPSCQIPSFRHARPDQASLAITYFASFRRRSPVKPGMTMGVKPGRTMGVKSGRTMGAEDDAETYCASTVFVHWKVVTTGKWSE